MAFDAKLLLVLACLCASIHSTKAQFRVSSISPDRGSLSGQTLVTITGSGFSSDLLSRGTSVKIDGKPCNVEWFYSGDNSIACRTPANPLAEEGRNTWNRVVEVTVDGNRDTSKRFHYSWGRTPRVEGVQPSGVSVGSEIAVLLSNLDPIPESIKYVYVGDQICDMRDDNGFLYGVESDPTYSSYTWVRCKMLQATPGFYNVSLDISEGLDAGMTWNSSNGLFVRPDRGLAMVEVFPGVEGVSPQIGSVEGGTVLTIAGTGFGAEESLVQVDVDGIPCDVISLQPGQIQCRTGKPSPGHASIADAADGYPSVGEGHRFRGSRGVSVERYTGTGINGNLDTLINHASFPASPQSFYTYPTFEPPTSERFDQGGERYSAFFTPLMSGQQRLWMASDDDGDLRISMTSNISDADQIASVNGRNSWNRVNAGPVWNDWRRYGDSQRASMMSLDAEQSYLLVGHVAENSYSDFLRVGAHYPEAEYFYNQTKQSIREEQVLTLQTEILRERQAVSVAVNLTALDPGTAPPSVGISWGSRTTEPISVFQLNDTDIVEEMVMELFSARCEFQNTNIADVSYSDFESGSAWPRWSGTNPQIVEYEQFCGRYSIMVQSNGARPFSLDADDGEKFELRRFPYLCMGYKIPSGSNVIFELRLESGDGERNYNLNFTGTSHDSFTAQVVADDSWQYGCYKVDDPISTLLETAALEDDRVLGFGIRFEHTTNPEAAMFFDEVAFVSVERTLTEHTPAARPNGVPIHSFTSSTVVQSSPLSDIWNMSITFEFLQSLCHYGLPLMTVSVISGADAIESSSVSLIQAASEPMGGQYSLVFDGHQTESLRFDASPDEAKLALAAAVPGIGDLASWSTPLLGDTLGRYCPGRRLTFRFERKPGDQPFIMVNSSNLTGTGVNIAYSESWQGGLFVRPLRGYMLQTAEHHPQVHVRVRDQLSSCGPLSTPTTTRPDVCKFVYSPTQTPSVTSLSATEIQYGDGAVITGSGFGSDPSSVQVYFGDAKCLLTQIMDTEIRCDVQDGSIGVKSPIVTVSPHGVASVQGALTVMYNPTVTDVSPNMVIQGGGTLVNVSGSGFVTEQCRLNPEQCDCGDISVTIGNSNSSCRVSFSSPTSLLCLLPASMAAEVASVTVTISCNGSSLYTDSLADAVTYLINSATVTSLLPAQGSSGGGTELTVSGTNLPTDMDSVAVLIGDLDAECEVTAASATSITCTTPPHPPGEASVQVHISDGASSGNALPPEGGLVFAYVLGVDGISHCRSSKFGGRSVQITGEGFGTELSAVSVNLGATPCQVFAVSDTSVQCTTRPLTTVHYIDNNAVNAEYGLGYRWSPDSLTIQVGDTVWWSWVGVAFAQWFSVAQVPTGTATEYSGRGFRSESSVKGNFSFTFYQPGVYHYIAESYARIGMRGEIRVVAPTDSEEAINLSVNGIQAPTASMTACDESPSCASAPPTVTTGHVSFEACSTPEILSVQPTTVLMGSDILISVNSVSSQSDDNVITIGGLPCEESNFTATGSIDLVERVKYIGDGPGDVSPALISCTLPADLAIGTYWVQLHVKGVGFGYSAGNNNRVTVQPSVVGVSPASGSLRGDSLVTITAFGFSENPLEKNQVKIGNSYCFPKHVTTNDNGESELTCFTQNAVDDGYSALVLELGPSSYWTFQQVYYRSDGTFSNQDFPTIRNHGHLSSLTAGTQSGSLGKGKVGVSGNSVQVNPGSVTVPYDDGLFGDSSFSVEVWLRGSDGMQSYADVYTSDTLFTYRVILSSFSTNSGESNAGFLLVLNPCEVLELWYAPEPALNASTSCDLVTSATQCPFNCSGLYKVDSSTGGSLPPGYWKVLSGPQFDPASEEWEHIVAVWTASSSEMSGASSEDLTNLESASECLSSNEGYLTCEGIWHMNVNGQVYTEAGNPPAVNYTGKNIQSEAGFVIGGDGDGYFVGYLDEVAVYTDALDEAVIEEHFVYHNSDLQNVYVFVDGVQEQRLDGEFSAPSRTESYSRVMMDWNNPPSEETVSFDSPTIVTFFWNESSHGLYQVDQVAYERCDLSAGRSWHRGALQGTVSIAFTERVTWYFVDSIEKNCQNGHKMTVTLGSRHEVDWALPSDNQPYADVTISKDTTLIFRWRTGFHNVVELRDVPNQDVCNFAGDSAGQVEREWHSSPSPQGEVYVTGLPVGVHRFVCTVGTHCSQGMRIKVTVTDQGNTIGDYQPFSDKDTLSLFWAIQEYPTLEVSDRTNLQFVWHDFHSLLQVGPEAYDACDISPESTIVEWSRPSVSTSALVPHLSPGSYHFICGVAGHCSAGMRLRVVVHALPPVPPLDRPVPAHCAPGACAFGYGSVDTPTLASVNPNQGEDSTTVQLTGTALVNTDNSTDGVSVWIGNSPCESLATVPGSADTIQCTVQDVEAGYHFVDVHTGKGLAAVYDQTSPTFGPHRNGTVDPSQNSPYQTFFVMASISDVTPLSGSLNGGTSVTIAGSSFSNFPSRVQVTVGSCDCVVATSTLSSISCVTTYCSAIDLEATSSIPSQVRVTVNGFSVTHSQSFEYSPGATPVIRSVQGLSGSAISAADEITITGDSFDSTNGASVEVKCHALGDGNVSGDCAVSFHNDTVIQCTAPGLQAGEYRTSVRVSTFGYSLEETVNAGLVNFGLVVSSFQPTMSGNRGGVTLSIEGSGFPASDNAGAVSVQICDIPCQVLSSTYQSVTCTAGSREVGNSTLTDLDCDVSAMLGSLSTTAVSGQFSYSGALTPSISGITPSLGGTAGGTTVTISGEGLWPAGVASTDSLSAGDVAVTIDGIACEVMLASATSASISCQTGSHRTSLEAEVNVLVKGKGLAVNGGGSVSFSYIDKWSSPYTWGGASPPLEGETVYIKAGQTVFLDIDTPVLNLILIEGSLIFEDVADVHLQAKYIFVNTGKLQIGTEDSPFTHRATITLHGTVQDPEIPVYGAKVIGVRQGELDIHGQPRSVTWTRLSQTAEQNTSSIYLQDAVDWRAGDEIVIAPTGKDGNETEAVVIASVEEAGHKVNLESQLNYKHFGITETFEDGQFIEIRAEVGLLSHNVVVQGSRLQDTHGIPPARGGDMYGAQVLVHRAGPHPTPVRIENAEFRHMGQAFRLGRYALHFHLSGSMNGSYIRGCAVHHSFNRAITAHGVHHVLFQDNVAYDIMGHTFFVEDGIESENMYIHNLGVLTRGSSSLLNTDQIPATFWITNPQNTFIDNAAVASRAYGFWYDLDNFPSGPSFTTSVCPNKMPFGVFRNNVAHSCAEFGLRIWESYTPFVGGCAGGAPATARLYNFTTYNNGIHGLEFSVVGHVQIHGFKVSDNRDNGMEIQETHGEWGGPLIKDSLIISHTQALSGAPGTGGIKTPNTPRLTISDVTFVNFNTSGTSCLRACSHCKVFQGGFQVWLNGIQFLGGSEANKAAFQWEHEVLFLDQDGTFSGSVGGWVLPDSALLPTEHCQRSQSQYSAGGHPGGTCTAETYFLRMAWNNAQPLDTLMGVNVNVTNAFGWSEVPWRHYRLTHLDGYMFVFPSGFDHSLIWLLPASADVDTTSYSAGVYGVRNGTGGWVTHQFVNPPDHVEVGGNYEGLYDYPTLQDDLWSWYMDNTTNDTTVTYLVSGRDQTEDLRNYLFTYNYRGCPRSGCPRIEIDRGQLEAGYRLWSNESAWPEGVLPRAGDDVTIESTWRMLLDVSPPPLGQVNVFGELKFQDEQDLNFTADLILVTGFNGRLVVGEETAPFLHKAIITLTGRTGTPDLLLDQNNNLGSKALGIFSNVSLIGKSVTTWSKLTSTAEAGATAIAVQNLGSLGWSEGDQILIAPSGLDPTEAEVRSIASISRSTITLDSPLHFDHKVVKLMPDSEIPSSPTWNYGNLAYYPEVGLLTRNVVVQGGEDPNEPLEYNHFGCRVLVGQYDYDEVETFVGKAEFSSVEFRYCGQGGYFSPFDPRYAIAFKDLFTKSEGSYVRGCSIHHGYNTAIGVHKSNGIDIDGNVVYRTTDSSIQVGGSGNTVTNNLCVLTNTIQPNRPLDNHAVDFPASFEVDQGNVLRHNHAAGSTRIGFKYHGEPCAADNSSPEEDSAMFWGNTAHTNLMGLLVMGTTSECTAVGGFTSFLSWDYNVFSSIASRLLLTHSVIASGKVGLNLNVFGPNPVAHLLGRKWIRVENSLIVGLTEDEGCIETSPPHAIPQVSFVQSSRKHGIMMSSFNQKRSKMSGTGPWHLMKGYPVIDGRLELTNVTFSRFFSLDSGCSYQPFALTNNPQSPDAVHPTEIRGAEVINVVTDHVAYFYDPNEGWINQEDCIDMDCDGPKHALIQDLDGSLLGSAPQPGSIIPNAQLRFDYSRIPNTWWAAEEFADRMTIVDKEGIDRGTHDPPTPVGCEWRNTSNAFHCASIAHRMLVIESMDADTEVRRISPIALVGGDQNRNTYTDLINGPMDHGWCTYYTCLKRLSTFFTIVSTGRDNSFSIWSTGTNPKGLRFHLLNAPPEEGMLLKVWYQDTFRKDVYKNGVYIASSNTQLTPSGAVYETSDDQFIPSYDTFSGANYFDRKSHTLYLLVKGDTPIEIRTPPVVIVSLSVTVTFEDFFNPDILLQNLAFVLQIPLSSIRQVDIVSESSSRGRRQAGSSNGTMVITVELGSEPKQTVDTPSVTSVEEQINTTTSDSVDDGATKDPGTGTDSDNIYNEDPPSGEAGFLDQYGAMSEEYNSSVQGYMEAVMEAAAANAIAEDLIELIQTGNLSLANVTVGGVTVQPAEAPPPPSPPVVPPEYTGAVEAPAAPLQPYRPVQSGDSNGSAVLILVPHSIVVVVHPPPETGNLVYLEVEARDEKGLVITHLGLSHPWKCVATVTSGSTSNGSLPSLGGSSIVQFNNGRAKFTRLRINELSTGVTLHLSTDPGNLQTTTTAPFSVVPPPANTLRMTLHFDLEGDYNAVLANQNGFISALKSALSDVVDVDESRITNVQVQQHYNVIVVQLDLLDSVGTDPPDSPGLGVALEAFRSAVNSQALSFEFGSIQFRTVRDSFKEGPFSPIDNTIAIIAAVCGSVGFILLLLAVLLFVLGCKKMRKNAKTNKVSSSILPDTAHDRDNKAFQNATYDHEGEEDGFELHYVDSSESMDTDKSVVHQATSHSKLHHLECRPSLLEQDDWLRPTAGTESPTKIVHVSPYRSHDHYT